MKRKMPEVLTVKAQRKAQGRELAIGRKQVRAIKYRETDLAGVGVRGDR